MVKKCSVCGAEKSVVELLPAPMGKDALICESCQFKRNQAFDEAADRIMITTTNHIECHMVDQYLGIESIEFVIGTGVFSEVTTNWQDFLGRRSTAFEEKLQAGKQAAFKTLKGLAVQKGANAIIGIDLDYTEFSGNRIGLIVSGTLVHVTRTTKLTSTKGSGTDKG